MDPFRNWNNLLQPSTSGIGNSFLASPAASNHSNLIRRQPFHHIFQAAKAELFRRENEIRKMTEYRHGLEWELNELERNHNDTFHKLILKERQTFPSKDKEIRVMIENKNELQEELDELERMSRRAISEVLTPSPKFDLSLSQEGFDAPLSRSSPDDLNEEAYENAEMSLGDGRKSPLILMEANEANVELEDIRSLLHVIAPKMEPEITIKMEVDMEREDEVVNDNEKTGSKADIEIQKEKTSCSKNKNPPLKAAVPPPSLLDTEKATAEISHSDQSVTALHNSRRASLRPRNLVLYVEKTRDAATEADFVSLSRLNATCPKCKEHGVFSIAHKNASTACMYEGCSCKKCKAVDHGREMERKRRILKKTDNSGKNAAPIRYCRKCKDHGVERRTHVFERVDEPPCEFKDCSCSKCQYTERKRQLRMRQIHDKKRRELSSDSNVAAGGSI